MLLDDVASRNGMLRRMDLRIRNLTQAEALRARQCYVDVRGRDIANVVLFERGFVRNYGLGAKHGRKFDKSILGRRWVVREPVQTLSNAEKLTLAGGVEQRRPSESSLHRFGGRKHPSASIR